MTSRIQAEREIKFQAQLRSQTEFGNEKIRGAIPGKACSTEFSSARQRHFSSNLFGQITDVEESSISWLLEEGCSGTGGCWRNQGGSRA